MSINFKIVVISKVNIDTISLLHERYCITYYEFTLKCIIQKYIKTFLKAMFNMLIIFMTILNIKIKILCKYGHYAFGKVFQGKILLIEIIINIFFFNFFY